NSGTRLKIKSFTWLLARYAFIPSAFFPSSSW
ncbi:MAG: hypothetical protein ACI8P9_001765, partial [Parasphingorhabdus sp.]